MVEQTFQQAVIESRVFYRRNLAEKLAVASMRRMGGVNTATIVQFADQIAQGLAKIEDPEAESVTHGTTMPGGCVNCGHDRDVHADSYPYACQQDCPCSGWVR